MSRGALSMALVVQLFLLSSSASAQEGRKWAVVVGVNDYEHFEEGPGGDLRGAERDARSFHEVLVRRWGFPEEQTTLLLSLEATKAAIHEAITGWAGSRVGPDDVFLFYFAGHGSQTFDDQVDEESDGLDETIAPTDAGTVDTDHDIRDDELREWLSSVPAGDVVVILDSCHSGSASRATGPMRPRLLDRPVPRPNVASRALGAEAERDAERISDGETRILEIAAAAPNQSAMEGVFQNPGTVSTFPAGAFTFYLVRQLWEAPPEASYQDLFRRVVSDLKAGHFTQDPQVSGPVDAPIFGRRGRSGGAEATAAAAPNADGPGARIDEVQVLRVDGGKAVLSGGAQHAMTAGSLYGTESGAVLRVVQVREADADAEAMQGSPVAGEGAELLEAALPEPSLVVGTSYLAPELASAVGAGVAEEPEIRIASDPDAPADIFLRPSEDERAIEILGRDGGLRAITLATGPSAEIAGRLVAALRKELAIKRLATLENPAARFTVDLEVGGGRRVFHEGDTISFRVRSERAGYLTLVDLGMDGTVTVLHPNGYEDFGLLAAGQEVQIPGDWAVFTIGEETGLGMVRAIVTPEPLRLEGTSRGMLQRADGAGLADEIRSLLQNQTRNILVQQREKDPSEESEAPAHQWSTAMVVYEVR